LDLGAINLLMNGIWRDGSVLGSLAASLQMGITVIILNALYYSTILQRDSTISCQIIIYLNYEIKVFETL
jgi:hypothetical protein